MSKRYHYFYIIVNKVNRKFYYGAHSTNDLNDGYMGSGTVLKAAIEKHGIENFVKTILGFFDTRDELMAIEREFVNEQFLESHKDECYNVALGGYGNIWTEEMRAKKSESMKGNIPWNKGVKGAQVAWNKGVKGAQVAWNKGKKMPPEACKKMSEKAKGRPSSFKGRKHTPESIKKIRESSKGRPAWNKGKHYNVDKETGKRVYY